MQKITGLFFISIFCIAVILTAGCMGAASKDRGTVTAPGTINGAGPASFKLVSPGGSHTFHVTSTGDHAGMIVTITGTKRDSEGKIKSGDIMRDALAPKGVDASKRLNGFIADTYTIEVLTTNDDAPWTIRIE